jgi:hypothetical protein
LSGKGCLFAWGDCAAGWSLPREAPEFRYDPRSRSPGYEQDADGYSDDSQRRWYEIGQEGAHKSNPDAADELRRLVLSHRATMRVLSRRRQSRRLKLTSHLRRDVGAGRAAGFRRLRHNTAPYRELIGVTGN